MGNKLFCVLAVIVMSVLLARQTPAATKLETTYRVQRAWFDAENVYVVYKKDLAKQHYSILDVHGTIVDEGSTIWMVSFPRSKLADGSMLQLKDDEPAKSVVYRDGDFTIATSGTRSVLSGRQIDGTKPICEKREDTGWPIRWHATIFYCGSLYSLSGHHEWEVPESLLQTIGAESRSSSRTAIEGLGQRKPVFCMESGNRFVVASSLGILATLRLGIWMVGQSAITWNTIPVGPQGATALVANGVVAYSPNRIVLKVKNDQATYWAQCLESQCNAIGMLNTDDSYLLLDDNAREAIALSIPNLTRPELRVQLAKL